MRQDSETPTQNPQPEQDRSLLQRVFGHSETTDPNDRHDHDDGTVYRATAEPVTPADQRYGGDQAGTEQQTRADQDAWQDRQVAADQPVAADAPAVEDQRHSQPAWQRQADPDQATWQDQQARADQFAVPEQQAAAEQQIADRSRDAAAWQDQPAASDQPRDTVAAAEAPAAQPGDVPTALVVRIWSEDAAREFRERWREAQLGFVDDPRQVAEDARGLVNELVEALTASLASHRQQLNSWRADGDTEQYRVIVQRYRTFFDRLLTL
jgi:hypothetical protein